MPSAILKMSGNALAAGGLAATLMVVVLGLAAMVIAAIALFRARREDIPAIFASFASSFGLRSLSAAVSAPKAEPLPVGDDSTEATGDPEPGAESLQEGSQ